MNVLEPPVADGGLLRASHDQPRRHTPPSRLRLPSYPPSLEAPWDAILGVLDYAFQPIVNIHTGYCYGFEALLRNYDAAGFESIQAFFDACLTRGVLAEVEWALQGKAIAKFLKIARRGKAKLFLNVDNRSLTSGFTWHRAQALADHFALTPGTLVFELSERHPIGTPAETAEFMQKFKRHSFPLALDDFGTGFSGLQLLYFAEPDLIKIDRFFISDIAADAKKKLFLANIVNIAHLLGATVVAEGVESEQEYFVCRDIGCDLIQGYLVQRPSTNVAELGDHASHIGDLGRRERRSKSSDEQVVLAEMETIPPLNIGDDMVAVFERFRQDKNAAFLPVVDDDGSPLGIIRDRDFKQYTYSMYGKDLMSNRAHGRRLHHFLCKCPIVDVNAKAENILQTFSASANATEGLIITKDMRYLGFLSAHSLVKIINEKNVAAARDQNPLSRLPGNNRIHEYILSALEDVNVTYSVVYFDFDNFKPFNDKYGFRLGDRAILLFAELLAKRLLGSNCFIGHIGGDDFFAGFAGPAVDDCGDAVNALIARFRNDVESFYDAPTRAAGTMEGKDREGNLRRFPLLGVSAAVVQLPAGRQPISTEDVAGVIASLKETAKQCDSHLCSASMVPKPDFSR